MLLFFARFSPTIRSLFRAMTLRHCAFAAFRHFFATIFAEIIATALPPLLFSALIYCRRYLFHFFKMHYFAITLII